MMMMRPIYQTKKCFTLGVLCKSPTLVDSESNHLFLLGTYCKNPWLMHGHKQIRADYGGLNSIRINFVMISIKD